MSKNKKLVIICSISAFIVLLVCAIVISYKYGYYYIPKKASSANYNPVTVTKLSNYNNPIVPQDFKKVETSSASWQLENNIPKGWNSGLVIEDNNENQFVWIPYDESYQTVLNDIDISCDDNRLIVEQIKKYGGFYISRYEAGIPQALQEDLNNFDSSKLDISDIPVSKKGVIPWNFISKDNAEKSAIAMYNNDKYVNSFLPTIEQREIIETWLSKCGYNIDDPKDYGNYSNVTFKFTGLYSIDNGKSYKYSENKDKSQYNMILSTGASDRNVTNNIYDLFGNVAESYRNIGRDKANDIVDVLEYANGGYYDNTSKSESFTHAWANSKIGFRIAIKILD